MTCVGWALASLSGCNPPALGALQVQLLPGALTTWPVRLEAGFQVLNLARQVRFPHGSLQPSGGIRQTRDAQNVVPSRRGSSSLLMVIDAGGPAPSRVSYAPPAGCDPR